MICVLRLRGYLLAALWVSFLITIFEYWGSLCRSAHPLQVLAQFVDAVLRNATPWVLGRQTKLSQSPI
jgi:hypothetical protein